MSGLTLQHLAILDWLYRYPTIRIKDGSFNSSWNSPEARKHMHETTTVIFAAQGFTPPDTKRQVELGEVQHPTYGTPKVGRTTDKALRRRELITEDGKLSKKGLEVLVRQRERLQGFTPKLELVATRSSRPRRVGSTEVNRRGGRHVAERYLHWHREREAHHKRIADHLEESIRIYDEEIVEQRERWKKTKGRM